MTKNLTSDFGDVTIAFDDYSKIVDFGDVTLFYDDNTTSKILMM